MRLYFSGDFYDRLGEIANLLLDVEDGVGGYGVLLT